MDDARENIASEFVRTENMLYARCRETICVVLLDRHGIVVRDDICEHNQKQDQAEHGVLLRADCDALPIQESPENMKEAKLCVSRVPSVAHMCGHDAHTAMLLSAAKLLHANENALAKRVYCLFERGEEGGNGIYYVMKYLEQARLPIHSCFACHVVADLPVGQVAVHGGATNAATFDFRVSLQGRPGHANRPDLAANPIDCFVAIADTLKDFRLRHSSPFTPLTYTISSVNCGQASNVIAPSLEFSGTCRYFDHDAGRQFSELLRQSVESCCTLYGCTASYLHFSADYAPCICSEPLAEFARGAIGAYLGARAIIPRGGSPGGESFAVLSTFYPSAVCKLGIRNEQTGCTASVHTPQFDIDETAMQYGTLMYTAYAVETLRALPDAPFKARYRNVDELFTDMGRPIPG